MELDEKYASVILRRYVDDTGDADGVYVIRDGKKLLDEVIHLMDKTTSWAS